MTAPSLERRLSGLLVESPNEPLAAKLADYLVQWRLSLWASIRHKELIIWSFIGFFATANGILLGPGRPYIGESGAVIAGTILAALGLHVVLDAASWNARNLFTIARIEKLFLADQAGVLIPRAYLDPQYRVSAVNCAQLAGVTAMPLLSYLRFTHVYFDGGTNALFPLVRCAAAGALVGAFFWFVGEAGRSYRAIYFTFRSGFEKDVDGAILEAPSAEDKHRAAMADPSALLASTGITATLIAFEAAVGHTAFASRRFDVLVALLAATAAFLLTRAWLKWRARTLTEGTLSALARVNRGLFAVALEVLALAVGCVALRESWWLALRAGF